MSVINDMLRDLNERRAPEVSDGRASVPQSLIEPQKNTLRTLLVMLIFVLCVAAVTAYWFVYLKDAMPGLSVSSESDHASPSAESSALVQLSPPADVAQQDASSVKAENANTTLQNTEAGSSVSNQVQTAAAVVPEQNNQFAANAIPDVQKENEPAETKLQPGHVSGDAQNNSVMAPPTLAEPSALPAPVANADKSTAITAIVRNKVVPDEVNEMTGNKMPERQAPHHTQTAMQVSLSPAARDRQMAEQALKQFASGQAEQAYRELMDFLEAHETDIESRAVLVNYLLQENRLAEAGDLLLNAPVQQSASLRQLKARWYAAQGDDKMALYILNSELPEIKQYPDYYVLLAAYYQRFGWHKEALKTYTALVEYDDTVADWWVGLALAADRTQDFRQAALAYELALELPGLTPELSNFVKNRLKQLRAALRNSQTDDVNNKEIHA